MTTRKLGPEDFSALKLQEKEAKASERMHFRFAREYIEAIRDNDLPKASLLMRNWVKQIQKDGR